MEKFAFNLQLQPCQILTNDVQMIIFRLSYFVATVLDEIFEKRIPVPDTEMMAQHDSIRDREQPSRYISQYYCLLNINIVYIRARGRAIDLILYGIHYGCQKVNFYNCICKFWAKNVGESVLSLAGFSA